MSMSLLRSRASQQLYLRNNTFLKTTTRLLCTNPPPPPPPPKRNAAVSALKFGVFATITAAFATVGYATYGKGRKDVDWVIELKEEEKRGKVYELCEERRLSRLRIGEEEAYSVEELDNKTKAFRASKYSTKDDASTISVSVTTNVLFLL
ncbi:hypothetical protein KSS87_008307 [Heliosperma pusillum]|nr:hypothetical protein KSS87_008307 [Heliosperma pusillum]